MCLPGLEVSISSGITFGRNNIEISISLSLSLSSFVHRKFIRIITRISQ